MYSEVYTYMNRKIETSTLISVEQTVVLCFHLNNSNAIPLLRLSTCISWHVCGILVGRMILGTTSE